METRILIVENDAVTALDLEALLTEAGYIVSGIAASANEGLELARATAPNLALLDIGIAGRVDGIELALSLRQRFSLAHIYLTCVSGPDVVGLANRTQPLGYIAKPFDGAELLTGINIALCRQEQRCKAASAVRSPSPFVIDRRFSAQQSPEIVPGACPMEVQCSPRSSQVCQ